MVKTLVLDVDFDEKSTILFENPSISNPTGRLPSAEKQGGKATPQPRKYGLRTRQSKPKYKEETDEESILKSKDMISDHEDEDVVIIDTFKQNHQVIKRQQVTEVEEEKLPERASKESKIGYIDENKVKAMQLAKALKNGIDKQQKRIMFSSF